MGRREGRNGKRGWISIGDVREEEMMIIKDDVGEDKCAKRLYYRGLGG